MKFILNGEKISVKIICGKAESTNVTFKKSKLKKTHTPQLIKLKDSPEIRKSETQMVKINKNIAKQKVSRWASR